MILGSILGPAIRIFATPPNGRRKFEAGTPTHLRSRW